MADYSANIFAVEAMTTTKEDIELCIGEKANNKTIKINEAKRQEMGKEINMNNLDKVVNGLKSNKAPGTSGFRNTFCKEFYDDLNLWIIDYIKYTKEAGKLSFLQRQGSVTLIPKGQKVTQKKLIGNWRPITLLNTLYKIIATILGNKI